MDKETEDKLLASALAKAKACFPHLVGLDDKTCAQNACRLKIPGLTGLEILVLAKAAGPRGA